jgi:hypothetical protein
MKWLTLLLVMSLFLAGAASPGLGDVKTVYLLPMANALDQFLALRLTTGVILQVVTDPQKADAVLTDHIGSGFEQQLTELYGAKPQAEDQQNSFSGSGRATMQPLSRGKGTIFLVDRKTRNVLWSTFALPKGNAPAQMHQVADRIALQLDRDRKGK